MYNNSKKMIENLLEINTNKLTTSILCATLHCPSVQMLADKILDTYKRQAKMVLNSFFFRSSGTLIYDTIDYMM